MNKVKRRNIDQGLLTNLFINIETNAWVYITKYI